MCKCRKILPNFEQLYDVIKGLNQNSVSYNARPKVLLIISNHKNSYILKNVYTYPSTVLEIFEQNYPISRKWRHCDYTLEHIFKQTYLKRLPEMVLPEYVYFTSISKPNFKW